MRINCRAIIRFFDEDSKARPHSNAIKTLAGEELSFELMRYYFRRKGISASLLEGSCTTGRTKGPRLDGWFQISEPARDTLFQVEVKSWSFHGYKSGEPLPLELSPEDLRNRKIEKWNSYWNSKAIPTNFHAPLLQKVLVPMRKRIDFSGDVFPLACLWDAVHPEGAEEPFFSVPISGPSSFTKVFVFSCSSFLRGLVFSERVDEIDLDLPITKERLNYLHSIFHNEHTSDA